MDQKSWDSVPVQNSIRDTNHPSGGLVNPRTGEEEEEKVFEKQKNISWDLNPNPNHPIPSATKPIVGENTDTDVEVRKTFDLQAHANLFSQNPY